MHTDQYEGIELTPREWAQKLDPILPLELAMLVERLGGWTEVHVLSCSGSFLDRPCTLSWYAGAMLAHSGHRFHMNPHEAAVPECWYIYAVRRATDG